MHISIWQQFSSNHSGFFWVVGTFESFSEAEGAFKTLREMLFAIDQWHREHVEEYQTLLQTGLNEALPPEQAYAEQFQVDWQYPIDWTNWANYYLEDWPGYESIDAQRSARHMIDAAIRIVGRNVIVSNPDQTWMTIQPFEGILASLGAETIGYDLPFIESEAGKDFAFSTTLTFTAPNPATADRIEGMVRQYLAGDLASLDNPPPWHDDEANYQHILAHSRLLKAEPIDLLKQNWQQRYLLHMNPTPSPYGLEMPAKRLALRHQELHITRDAEHFTWTDLWFHNQELGVSALIAWLEVNGCIDIDFRYMREKLDNGESTNC
ncbi:MAG: hypothetical protein CL610_06350 [Anaerolineaceae bacterium]|nr:hypothetical protein [Anaerolineaceae bacterium]